MPGLMLLDWKSFYWKSSQKSLSLTEVMNFFVWSSDLCLHLGHNPHSSESEVLKGCWLLALNAIKCDWTDWWCRWNLLTLSTGAHPRVIRMFVIKNEKYMMNLLCTMAESAPFPQSRWWFSTSIRILIFYFLFSFFFICLQMLLPSFRADKHHSNKRQLELQPVNTRIKNKARFWVFVFSWVWCVFTEWRCDCAVCLHAVVLLGPYSICNTTACQDGTAQETVRF